MNDLTDAFEKSRRRLFGLAYRMLQSAADAEDIVEETYLRAQTAAADDLRSPESFFVTIATRLCLDQLKSARAKRLAYVGSWLPEPIADIDGLSPAHAVEHADDLSFALLMTLEKLSPPERAAFLLHDVFGEPFQDIAKTLDKSEASCRQLATRARRSVRQASPARKVAAETHRILLAGFIEAIASGDPQKLSTLLAADAVAWSDGGGAKRAALNPIFGADKIARYFTGIAAKAARLGVVADLRDGTINGAPAIFLFRGDQLDQTLSIATDGVLITAVYVVSNPEKLRAVTGSTT